MKELRCFISVPVPGVLKKALAGVQEALESSSWDVRWVPLDNFHLTLHFLGNIPERLLEDLRHDLRACGHRFRPFDMKAGGLGAFPDLKDPRVVWIGLKDEGGMMSALVKDMYGVLMRRRTFELRDDFQPHLTLGRVKALKNWDPRLVESLLPQWADLGILPVERFELMKSLLDPRGSRYEVLREFQLERDA